MTAPKSRLLVIDTSIICSASETEHAVSSACRKALKAVLDICHRVALTDPIGEEWRTHTGRYARKWRLSMEGRKKVKRIVNPRPVTIDMRGLPDDDRQAIEKDLCLIEAALSADGMIVTRDETLRRILDKTPKGRKIAASITWINPVTDGIEVFERL